MDFTAETDEPAKSSGSLPKFNRRHRFLLTAGIALVALVALITRWSALERSLAADDGRDRRQPQGRIRSRRGRRSSERQPRGVTLLLTVPAGGYKLTVQHGAAIKEMPVSVSKGVATVHHITWTDPPAAPVEKGHLSVGTDPVGGIVIVDGVTRGAAPLTLRDLPVGAHRVVVRARGTTYTRTVQIEAGTTASLFFEGSQAVAVAPGSIAIESRVPVQVFEDKRLVGTSQMDRIILPAGEHALEFVADSVGFRSTHTVHVAAGETTAIPVESLDQCQHNALPWAEVFTRIGETPLGNLQQTLGPHEIVFRHPQLGERRMHIVVTMKDANRISMDMRQR